MNFNSISGLFILLFCLNLKVFAYKTYKCEENYHLFHKWYMKESKVFLIKNENILNLLDKNQELTNQLKVDVTPNEFNSFCDFYNRNAEKNETYSPCNDQSYDIYSCFRRFILLLNENINVVIDKFIEYGNSNYVLNELNRSLICNHSLNERSFSIKDYFEKSCYICIEGLASTSNNCSSIHSSTITEKCCLVGSLLSESSVNLKRLNNDFNLDNIHNLNKEMLIGKYKNLIKNVKPFCLGPQSRADCICPKGYSKSDQQDCIDLDECEDLTGNYCTYLDNDLKRKYDLKDRNVTDSICVNTFGKFVCVRIDCPKNYELVNNKCYLNDRLYYKLTTDEKFAKPRIIAMGFISLPKNVMVPNGRLELFRIDNTSNADYNYKIHKVNSIFRNMNEIEIPYVLSPDLNKDEAELTNYFSLKYNNETKQAILYLTNEIKSPVEVQVIILTSWHSHDKKTFGITNIVLNIYVTN